MVRNTNLRNIDPKDRRAIKSVAYGMRLTWKVLLQAVFPEGDDLGALREPGWPLSDQLLRSTCIHVIPAPVSVETR